jgi:ABC-2 type transport system ATP-binding protein
MGVDRRSAAILGHAPALGLAASLLRASRPLVVDEPTIGLDPIGAREVRDLIRDLPSSGVTVLMSSHNMPEVDEVCDAVTILNEGSVVWDGPVERLRAEAPVPAYRLATSDDARASDLARSTGGVGVEAGSDDELTVIADQESLDRFVIALGHQGIAVRRLELVMSALESMFFELTGSRSTPAEAKPERAAATEGSDP